MNGNETVFRGVMTPILTPLTPDGEIDDTSLRRLVDYLLDGGVHGLWAAGTNGEFGGLEDQQRLQVVRIVMDAVAGRVPVIANASASATRATISLARALEELKPDGIAATPPYYYAHNQAELLDHYRAIKAAVSTPLWIYNIPSTVKTTVAPATIATLAAEGTVAGVKDSTSAGEALAELVARCRRDGITLLRFIGTVYRASMTRVLGGHGIIPAISNVVPGATADLWEAGENGDGAVAARSLERVLAAQDVAAVAAGSGSHAARIGGMKAALQHLGVISCDQMTPPLKCLTVEEKQRIPPILKAAGLS